MVRRADTAVAAPGGNVIQVVLADDHAAVRVGFRMILTSDPEIEVVGEAADGAEAVSLCADLRPDVLLLDVQMPGTDGLTAARQVLDSGHPPKVLMLTTFHVQDYVFEALRAGASGYLLKDLGPDELTAAVHAVCAGDLPLSPAVTRSLVQHYVGTARPPSTNPALQLLTPRETDVLRRLGAGATNAELVADLHLSLSTVKTHVAAILLKLGLRDRVQAAILACESGLVSD
jgi:DNA-binding NarL/FixJ family response regulator